MATFQSVFIPASPTASTLFNGTITTGNNTTIVLGNRQIFAIVVAGGQANIRFGNATRVPTATGADWPLFAAATQEWETGEEFDRINIFNGSGATVTYWVYEITRT